MALKVILRSLAATPAALDLFRKEGLQASMVNHPNVVTIFDVIEHEGMTCMVMELLEGESLQRYMERRGALSVQEALALLLPAMRGVAAAHAQGVIHRDLKPHNIFLCTEPNGSILTTKVLDFGISVLVDRVLESPMGPFVGSPNYMSPEHVAGLPAIDGRVDVYGFGLLLYEALTGQLAFSGEPGQALFDAILSQPAPSVTSLRPDVAPAIVAVIEKALAKRPDQRFATLHEMIITLESQVEVSGLVVLVPSLRSGVWAQAGNAPPSNEALAPNQYPDTRLSHGRPGEAPGREGSTPRARRTADVVVTLTSGFYPRHSVKRPLWGLSWKSGLVAASGVVLGALLWTAMAPAISVRPGRSTVAAGVAQGPSALRPLSTSEMAARPRSASMAIVTPIVSVAATDGASQIPERKLDASDDPSASVASGVRSRQSSRELSIEISRTPAVRRAMRSDSGPADLHHGAAVRRLPRAGALSVSDF